METVFDVFQRLYGRRGSLLRVFCPYRVCPLGAHVDHQRGKVTGFALDRGIEIFFEPTNDGIVQLRSVNLPGETVFSVEAVPPRQGDWGDYLRGAAQALSGGEGRGVELARGVRGVVNGMLPIGGLSSSAALTIAFLSALCHVNGVALTPEEVIRCAMRAESEYVGVRVGSLDQSCEMLAKKDSLLYLDTADGRFERIPAAPKAKPFEIAILFSGVERSLVGSQYNQRVDELKAASYALKAFAGLPCGRFADSCLRDVPPDVFAQYGRLLPEPWQKRAKHFYSECARAEQGAAAWRRGDIEFYGRLCFESGYSSIYLYETGSDELRALYDLMLDTPGVYGGRFSGAGFKGCCMALVDPARRDEALASIAERYARAFPALKDAFSTHICRTADGCRFGEAEELGQ